MSVTNAVIVIPSYIADDNHVILLDKCIKTIRKGYDNKIIIVDDHSPDQKLASDFYLQIDVYEKNIEIIRKDKNEGFSKTVNKGLKIAHGRGADAILVNADVEFVDQNWIHELYKLEADIVGGKLIYSNGTIQHGGIYFSPFTRSFAHRYKSCDMNFPAANVVKECPVTAALQLIKFQVMEKIGFYDEDFKMGFEDVDYQLRALQAGFKCLYNPDVLAVHHESMFRGGKDEKISQWEKESVEILMKKYVNVDFQNLLPTKVEYSFMKGH